MQTLMLYFLLLIILNIAILVYEMDTHKNEQIFAIFIIKVTMIGIVLFVGDLEKKYIYAGVITLLAPRTLFMVIREVAESLSNTFRSSFSSGGRKPRQRKDESDESEPIKSVRKEYERK